MGESALWPFCFSVCCFMYFSFGTSIQLMPHSALTAQPIQTQTVVIVQQPATETHPTKPVEWQPPELPEDCTNISIYFDGCRWDFPVWLIKDSSTTNLMAFLTTKLPAQTEPIGDKARDLSFSNQISHLEYLKSKGDSNAAEFPIIPSVRDRRLFVFVKIPFQVEKRAVLLGTQMDSAIPDNWDRNYSSNAFEVVNENTNPVLQVIYRRSNEVEVNGIFLVNDFDIIASFQGEKGGLFKPVFRVAVGDQPTQEFSPESFARTFTNLDSYA